MWYRALFIAAVLVGIFALVGGDWLVVLALVFTGTAMARQARRRKP
jgi:hypothetical protein